MDVYDIYTSKFLEIPQTWCSGLILERGGDERRVVAAKAE